MTPREPDRFDKQARELMDSECPHERDDYDEIPCVLCLADFLRAAESSALERSAEIADWHESRLIANSIRALIPPAAALAAEPGKAQGADEIDELAAVLRGKDGMGEKLARALGVPAGPLGRLVDAAIARIAELESDFRAYAEWATSEFGWRAWQPNETYDAWCARLAARAAPPEREGT